MNDLTPRQAEILACIRAYQHQHGWSPSLAEIGSQVGISSKSTTHAHLVNLERKGYIERGPRERMIRVIERTP